MNVHHTGNPDNAQAKAPMRETGVAQVMTSTRFGKHPTAFTATGLPILRLALDVAAMAPALLPLLAPLASGPESAHLSYARLLAYKQGNRGTIRYDVEANGRPMTILGKLYPHPTQVARVHAIMKALWQDTFAATPDLGVPRPLGTVPELSMLVYVPVDGTPLDELLAGSEGPPAVEGTARWLSALHGADLELDRRLHVATEVVNLQAWAALVSATYPEEGPVAARLAAGLTENVGAIDARPETPIHKDFHYKHVLVGSGVRVIDFDEVRHGDPMYDVAHFCAHLRLLACRSADGAAAIANDEGRFLESYVGQSGRSVDSSFPWYAAYTCLKIAKQLCSVRGVRPHPDGEEQDRQLSAMLQQGMAFRDLLR